MPSLFTHCRRGATVTAFALIVGLIAGCSILPSSPPTTTPGTPSKGPFFTLDDHTQTREVVLFAMGLLDTDYRFGGRNPEAGLDCSGMVSYVVEQVSGRRLPHNAAAIAERTRPIAVSQLQPGDLVFFNTMKRRYSHMGIYIGDGKFIHAPSTRGSVRIERMNNPYFSSRLDGARSLLGAG